MSRWCGSQPSEYGLTDRRLDIRIISSNKVLLAVTADEPARLALQSSEFKSSQAFSCLAKVEVVMYAFQVRALMCDYGGYKMRSSADILS